MPLERDAVVDTFDEDFSASSKRRKLASAPKYYRMTLIQGDPMSEDARHSAAIEIQRVYRGYLTRCRFLGAVYPNLSKTVVVSASPGAIDKIKDIEDQVKEVEEQGNVESGRQKLERMYNEYVSEMIAKGYDKTSPEIMSFDLFCQKYLQNWWNEQSKQAVGTPASQKISRPPRKLAADMTNQEAATIIQKAWRKHIDVQVYRYYRDLINFRSRGDPMMMLRCINPNEAKLLDSALGIHIKFRLAGEKFPPNIYYKIYTHRPVQDLCANSPKDYTKADTKRLMARDVHNKGNRVSKTDKSGWYKRIENNGWRLVSDRLITNILSDPVTWETSRKPVEFSHNKLQRKSDLDRKRKQKKINWMKKMYKAGMLKAKVDDPETVQLIEGAAAGMVATINRHGPEAVQDWEVDELLDWTTSLNFDEYWNEWKYIATSGCSEKGVAERLEYSTGINDPFEITVSANIHRDGSTRQSHNTPVSTPSLTSLRA